VDGSQDINEPAKLTWFQRMALRELRKQAGKSEGEPLSEEDWAATMSMHSTRSGKVITKVLTVLPSSPRCSMCGAPFGGVGGRIVRPLGYRPSRKNPHLCVTCIELSPPGGITVPTGVLFADLRGFTARSEGSSPREVSQLLRRFYSAAEGVLFPEAIIDKLIGDAVMALYLPFIRPDISSDGLKRLMFAHAEGLLEAVGYGSPDGPFGETYVGNIGDRALYDFTAVGDVVNTASRLQGEAQGGEIVLSASVASGLGEPPGVATTLQLKGKAEPMDAYRASVG
jgi:adenylate cyclase